MSDEHWSDARCDNCGRRIHPNDGALCNRCVTEDIARWQEGDA